VLINENFSNLRRFVNSYKLDLLMFNIKKYDDEIIKKALVNLTNERMIEITKLIVNNMLISDTYNKYFGLIRDVYEKNNIGLLAGLTLICASQTNRRDVVEFLIENKIDINTRDNYGCTCLIKASEFGNLEIVKYLYENNADVNLKNRNNETALFTAGANCKIEVVKFLMEQYHNGNYKTVEGIFKENFGFSLIVEDVSNYMKKK
jgi:ankyrin repeat protein